MKSLIAENFLENTNKLWSAMQFFAIMGTDTDRACMELQLFWAEITDITGQVVYFNLAEALQEHRFAQSLHFWSIIKWWCVVDRDFLEVVLGEFNLIGVPDKTLGMRCKKELWVKRFKIIDEKSTDREIREEWVAMLDVGKEWFRWVVVWYQDIPRFEAIDFEKPMRSMQTGMMPAKLTQTLVNIAVWSIATPKEKPTVFDPFCGFGTTWFIANSSGYNFLWSDINPVPTQQNLKWWEETQWYTDSHFKVFTHDIHKAFTQPFVKYADCIATEWWLWPVISERIVQNASDAELDEKRTSIDKLYISFLKQIDAVLPEIPIVITYPQWTFIEDDMSVAFCEQAENSWYKVMQVGALYKRKWQQVARRVLLLMR